MDLTKAQRLLNKIQAFLDNGNGHELSRLEKDLIKSYVLQLYEVVTSDEDVSGMAANKNAEMTSAKNLKAEPPHQKSESHIPKVFEEIKSDPVKPFYSDYIPPANKVDPPVKEYTPPVTKADPVTDYSSPPKAEPKPFEYTPPEPKVEHTGYEQYQPPKQEKFSSFQSPEPEVKTDPQLTEEKSTSYKSFDTVEKDNASKMHSSPGDTSDALQKLFELQKPDEMSSRFGHVPISSIESAMGLNERIFTLNELFGGDKALFDAWCGKLNSLNSFSEARQVLVSGPAKDFKWADPERIKMAEQFIRIVARRYPKALS